MKNRPSKGRPSGAMILLVTCLLVIGCNNNTLSGSSRSTNPNGGPSGTPGSGPDEPKQPGTGGTPTAGDKTGDPGDGKPADKIDSSSEEACKKTLLTTGFKDSENGMVYKMLEGEHTYCKGHKKCDELGAKARFPIAGEKTSEDILRCGGYMKYWLDEKANSQKIKCDDGRTKSGSNLALSGASARNDLSLYTFEVDQPNVSLDKKAQIICVYKDKE